MGFIEVLGAIASGGATGLLGTFLSGSLAVWKGRQANAHEIRMRELDIEETNAEAEADKVRAGLQMELANTYAANEALIESYKSERSFLSRGMKLTPRQQWLVVFIDFVRGMMRPVITLYFIVQMHMLYKQFGPGHEDESTHLVASTIYITTTVVLWWFGTRATQKFTK